MPRLSRVDAKETIGSGAFALWRLATRTKVEDRGYSGFIAAATYTPWRADAGFIELNRAVADHTLLDPSRLYELHDLVGQLGHIKGDILEVGVWRGGSGCLMAARAAATDPDCTVILADTFTGVVKAGERDPNYDGGEHADTSVDIVRGLADQMGLTNVDLAVGIFPDDTDGRYDARTFKLVHVDVDVYSSAADVTEWAWPRLAVGGVLVYDDYGTPTTSGVREFVDEFAAANKALRIHNINQHAIIVKTA